MTFIPHDIEPRTLYISKAGNDKADGDECPICLSSFEELTSRIANLSPPPSQSDQAAAISLARGRYDPVSTVEFPAWCQVDMPTVTVADGNMSSGPTYKAASTSGVVIQGVTSLLAGETAYSFDGTSRSGIEADAITSLFGGNALEMINGAEGSFCEVGQIIGDGICVYIDTQGDRPSISNSNVVDMVADGATGYYVNVKDGAPCFMKGNAVRLAASPFGGPTPTTATALKLVSGDTITYDYQLTQGDIEIDGGKSTIHIQHYKDGDITQNDGEHYFDIQVLEGNINAVGGRMVIQSQEIVGDITQNSSSTEFGCNSQVLTGNMTLGAGVSGCNILVTLGNVTTTSGLHYLTLPAIIGDLLISGNSNANISVNEVIGDFTVAAGSVCTGQINKVTGIITITGTFNGEIAGIKYGSWVEGDEVVFTGIRNGSIQSSYDDACLVFTIDTTTDTIEEIVVGYKQSNVNLREVNFRVASQDGLTTYFEDTISTTGVGQQAELLSLTPVAALPSNQVVTLVVEAERQTGGQTTDANCQVNIKRV